MENYKLATQHKLRFTTSRGVLSTEQLWDLPIEELDTMAVELEKAHQEAGKKSFLTKVSAKDKISKLKFDIVLDVLNTKVEERQLYVEAAQTREHNKKIIELISQKKDEEIKGKSIQELEALLK